MHMLLPLLQHGQRKAALLCCMRLELCTCNGLWRVVHLVLCLLLQLLIVSLELGGGRRHVWPDPLAHCVQRPDDVLEEGCLALQLLRIGAVHKGGYRESSFRLDGHIRKPDIRDPSKRRERALGCFTGPAERIEEHRIEKCTPPGLLGGKTLRTRALTTRCRSSYHELHLPHRTFSWPSPSVSTARSWPTAKLIAMRSPQVLHQKTRGRRTSSANSGSLRLNQAWY